MKEYVYTARNAVGVLKRDSIEAPDRNTALAALKAQGLAPVSLAAGSAPHASNRWRVQGIYMVLSIVGLAIIIYVALTLRPAVGQESKRAKAPAKLPPVQKPHPAAVNEAVVPSASALEEQPAQTVLQKQMAVLGNGVNEKNSVRDLHSDQTASSHETATNKPRRVFTTGTEQIIGWIANARMGDPPPILPMLPAGEDIEKILDTDIVLYDDDGEKIELIKTRVAEMKQQLKSYLDAGGNAEEFLQFYQKQLREAHDEWRVSQSELIKRLREGNQADAAIFLEERNKELMARGIKPLLIPPSLRGK